MIELEPQERGGPSLLSVVLLVLKVMAGLLGVIAFAVFLVDFFCILVVEGRIPSESMGTATLVTYVAAILGVTLYASKLLFEAIVRVEPEDVRARAENFIFLLASFGALLNVLSGPTMPNPVQLLAATLCIAFFFTATINVKSTTALSIILLLLYGLSAPVAPEYALLAVPLAIYLFSVRGRLRRMAKAVLLSALLMGVSATGAQAPPVRLHYPGGVSISFWIYPRNLTDEEISLLKELDSKLYVLARGWSEGLGDMIRRLNSAGIPVYLWHLPEGEYVNVDNYNEVGNLTFELVGRVRAENLTVRGFVFDVEPPRRIERNATEEEFRVAVEHYEGIIDALHELGYEAVLCAPVGVLSDLISGGIDWQMRKRVAAIPPRSWDWATWMVYRSDPLGTVSVNSYFVYAFGKLIRRYSPITSQISLGVAGLESYSSLGEVIRDIMIAGALGYKEVMLFRYGTFIEAFGLEGLRELVKVRREEGDVVVRYDPLIAVYLFGMLA